MRGLLIAPLTVSYLIVGLGLLIALRNRLIRTRPAPARERAPGPSAQTA